MKQRKIKSIFLLVFLISGILFAQVPQTISYQGVLTDAAGTNVADGDYSIVFTFYDAVTDGTNLWTETQTVTVTNGLFNVILGSVNPLDLDFDQQYWLGISIESGEELTPRTQLTSSAYSLNTNNIPDNIVTAEKVADGNLVKSVNSIKDNVTLAAGSNVNITESGNTITISASGGGSGGTITSVNAGNGLTGGGSSGDVSLNVAAGDGITVTADAVSLNNSYTDARYVNEGQSNSITNAMIQNDAVSAAKVSTNIVSSLDGVSNDGGNIDLVAGSNVTITPDDAHNKITIAASGGSSGDNLGNHTATQNIKLNGHYLSGDGGSEGVYVKSDGKVGVGTSSPSAALHVNGNDGVLFQGTYGSGSALNLGEGTRMMWYPKKSAFRAGYIRGNQWNDVNIGNYSVAMGYTTIANGIYSTAMGANTTASGDFSTAMGETTTASGNKSIAMGSITTASGVLSTAMGNSTTASGFNSTAMGYNTTASGGYSTAMGESTTASGDRSTAMGSNTIAKGYYSTAMGSDTKADSYNSFAIGYHNVGGGTSNNWISTDPLFEIGNGTSSTRSNAVTVLKNGKVGIGTASPAHKLQLHNTTSGYVYTSFTNSTTGSADGNGVLIGIDANEDFRIHSYENNNIKFYINSSEKMRIASSGKVGIGTTSPSRKLFVNGDAGGTSAWHNDSDRRLKKNIKTISNALDKVNKLRGVNFNWKKTKNHSKGLQMGFIAQEAKEVIPEVVEKKGEYYSMQYAPITALLVEAVKEQNAEFRNQNLEFRRQNLELKERIKKLEEENEIIRNRNAEVRMQNEKLKEVENEMKVIKAALNKLVTEKQQVKVSRK